MKNKLSFLTLLILCFLGLTFTSSNIKEPYEPSTEPACETLPGLDAYIQINLQLNTFSAFRAFAYTNYIPQNDLRTSGNTNPSTSLYDDKYYCVVTVTSPQCSAWQWTRVMDLTNTTNGGKMQIKTAPNGYNTHLKVEYYEATSNANGEPPFNNHAQLNSLKYTFEHTYLGGWSGSIPQPITLVPATLVERGPVSSGKSSGMSDYSGINNYIDFNVLNP